MARRPPRKEDARMKATIYLEPEQWVALRKAALDERTSATKLVERLITEYLGKLAKKGREGWECSTCAASPGGRNTISPGIRSAAPARRKRRPWPASSCAIGRATRTSPCPRWTGSRWPGCWTRG